jgi:hypothetical protein
MPMRNRGVGVAILAGVAALVLIGCTAPSPEPTSSESPAPEAIRVPEGDVVATGTFTDSSGHVTGDVTIAAAADTTFVLAVAGFSSSIATSELSASGEPISADQRCFTEPWRMGFGTPAGTEFELELPLDDPSFIASIAVTTLPAESSIDCALEYVGYANLTWDMPDLRPDLVIADKGEIEHAQGAVTLDSDGAPLSYTAVEGDRISLIAKRLGISQDDLRYLNPTDPLFGGSTLDVPAGEILNLSKDDR